MKVDTRSENGRTVLYLDGRITVGAGDVELRDTIQELLDQGVRDIVIDLEGMTKVDSSGIAELVAGHATMTNRGGSLKLRNLPPKLQDIL